MPPKIHLILKSVRKARLEGRTTLPRHSVLDLWRPTQRSRESGHLGWPALCLALVDSAFAGVTNKGTDYLLSWTTGCDQPMERTGQA